MLVCSVDGIDAEIEGLTSKANDYVALAERLIERQSTQGMQQDEFLRKYEEHDNARNELIKKIQAKTDELTYKKAKAKSMEAFIADLEKRPMVLEHFDDDIWCYLIDTAKVNRDKTITFLFRNGKEIKI